MSIAWTGEKVRQRSCEADMRSLLHYSNDSTQTFQLSYDNRGSDLTQTLAAFLILRPTFALFQFGVIGPYECASGPCGCDKHSTPDAHTRVRPRGMAPTDGHRSSTRTMAGHLAP